MSPPKARTDEEKATSFSPENAVFSASVDALPTHFYGLVAGAGGRKGKCVP